MDLVECGAEVVLLDLEVVAGLQVEPEPVGGAEVAGQPQRRVGGDPTVAVGDLVDPARPDTDRDGEVVLGDLQRGQEVLEEDLPGWIGGMVAIGGPPSGQW